MNTKSFLVLLIAALVLGGSLGAVFAVGMNPSKSQGGGSTLSRDDLARFRQQAKDWGFISRDGRTGRIERLEGKTVMMRTPQGLLMATTGEETIIRKSSGEVTLADITIGMLVTVNGQQGASGETEASEILVIREGEGGFTIHPGSGENPNMVPIFP